jgi:hypothetical protein
MLLHIRSRIRGIMLLSFSSSHAAVRIIARRLELYMPLLNVIAVHRWPRMDLEAHQNYKNTYR